MEHNAETQLSIVHQLNQIPYPLMADNKSPTQLFSNHMKLHPASYGEQWFNILLF
jgi:hypothetical protein